MLYFFQKAHVAIGAITNSASRELDVDFSKPFMDFRISLLMQKPKKEDVNLFVFLQPFERDVWLSTIAVVSTCLTSLVKALSLMLLQYRNLHLRSSSNVFLSYRFSLLIAR